MLYTLILVGVLAVLSASHFTKSVIVLLVSYSLLLLLLEFKLESVDIFSKGEEHVGLLLDVSLSAKNISFTTGDLLTNATDFTLGLIAGPILVS